MFGISDFIVCLWLAPITMFIILPLAMFSVWSVFRLVVSLPMSERAAAEPSRQLR